MKENWLEKYEAHKKQRLQRKEMDAFDVFMDLSEVEQKFDTDAAWDKVSNQISAKRPSNLSWLAKIAAVLVLCIGLGYLIIGTEIFSPSSNVEWVATSDVKSFDLPDGSTVHLNKSSAISFDSENFSEDRSIQLIGEAYFDVEKGISPFRIKSEKGEVQVVGTVFNVKATNSLEVYVVEGQVQVSTTKDKSLLKPLDYGIVDVNGNIKVTNGTHTNILTWKTGKLSFDNVQLKEVIPQLEKYYEVQIAADRKLENCKITAEFDQQSIKNVIDVIASILNASSTIQGKEILISGKGCN